MKPNSEKILGTAYMVVYYYILGYHYLTIILKTYISICMYVM